MSEQTPIEKLKSWITEEGFPDWYLEGDFAAGTYGLVFFINSKHANSNPSSLALKTLNPEALQYDPVQLEELQREFSKWIRLTSHRNVIDAYPFKTAGIPIPDPINPEEVHWIRVPIIPMERMDGTLTDWIGNERVSFSTKLCAIAQAFNGLSHLYANGIQGHGDLKPSNILYKDASNAFSFPGDNLLKNYPWIIKLADFGWTDAWVDYGFTNKALREYIAPERLGESPKVVPEKSDIFSMGIIAAELLTGKHPSKNLQKAKKSEGEWMNRVMRQDWDLSGLSSDNLRGLILSCLDFTPHSRPTSRNAMRVICEELKNMEGFDIIPTLERWNSKTTQDTFPFISERSEEIDRLMRTIGLGDQVEAKSVRRLREILKGIKPDGIYSLEDWVQAASGFLEFLDRKSNPMNQLEASRVRMQAKEHLKQLLECLDQASYNHMVKGLHSADPVTPFERIAHLVGHIAAIAGIDFEHVLKGEWERSPLGIAGFALHRASEARYEGDPHRTPIEYYTIAIDYAPEQAVPYYFRALRGKDSLLYAKLGINDSSEMSLNDVISDLETACRLAPEWSEPRSTLKQILDEGTYLNL